MSETRGETVERESVKMNTNESVFVSNFKHNVFAHVTSWVSILLGVLILGYGAYSTSYPFKTLDNMGFKILDDQKRVVAGIGKIITVELIVYKHTNLPCRYSFGLLDGYYQMIDSGTSNIPIGQSVILKKLKVSEELPAGIYRVQYTASYDISPLRTITKTFVTSNTFTVEP